MFNDPEWASKEEWDTYAWFGFAIQEAQALEQMLLVISVSLDMNKSESGSHKDRWFSLYDQFGRLTLGQLLHRVRKHMHFPDDLAVDLKKAVNIRNELAHAFFWPKDPEKKERTTEVAQKELMAVASLFTNLLPRLESIMPSLFDNIAVEREDAENKAAALMSNKNIQTEIG